MSKISRELFEVVYQWGRVGIVTDEHSPVFRQMVSNIDRKTLETIGALLNGDDNQVDVVKNYIHNKLRMYDGLDEEIEEYAAPYPNTSHKGERKKELEIKLSKEAGIKATKEEVDAIRVRADDESQ